MPNKNSSKSWYLLPYSEHERLKNTVAIRGDPDGLVEWPQVGCQVCGSQIFWFHGLIDYLQFDTLSAWYIDKFNGFVVLYWYLHDSFLIAQDHYLQLYLGYIYCIFLEYRSWSYKDISLNLIIISFTLIICFSTGSPKHTCMTHWKPFLMHGFHSMSWVGIQQVSLKACRRWHSTCDRMMVIARINKPSTPLDSRHWDSSIGGPLIWFHGQETIFWSILETRVLLNKWMWNFCTWGSNILLNCEGVASIPT